MLLSHNVVFLFLYLHLLVHLFLVEKWLLSVQNCVFENKMCSNFISNKPHKNTYKCRIVHFISFLFFFIALLPPIPSFSHLETTTHSVEVPNQTFSPATTLPGKPEELYSNAGLMPAIKVAGLGKYIQSKKNQTDAFKEEFTVNINIPNVQATFCWFELNIIICKGH